MKMINNWRKNRTAVCFVIVAIVLIPCLQIAIAQAGENGDTGDQNVWIKLAIIVLIGLGICGFLFIAIFSRKAILRDADDKGEIAEYLMKQTLGLPTGSIRGVLALTTALVFVGSVFFADEVPESVKIITALVFGYYFAKSTGQTKDVIDALQGKTKQRAVLKQQAVAALAEARAEGAATYAKDKFDKAEKQIANGDSKTNASEAIACYNQAIELASEAKLDAINARRGEEDARTKENNKKFDKLSAETRKRIDELIALKIESRGLIALWETARAQAESGNYEEANLTLDRVKGMVDIQLKEYDEAREIYENKLQEDQRKELQEAREVLNSSTIIDVAGEKMIESVLSVIGVLGDKDRGLIPLFKKRMAGEKFEASDVRKAYEGIKKLRKTNILSNIVDIAANATGIKLTPAIKDSMTTLDLLDKLVLGDDNVVASVYRSDFLDEGQQIEYSVFDAFVTKIRKNIVDYVIQDIVKKGLPDDVNFDAYKNTMKKIQDDKDGKGTLHAINKVLDVGETILSFTPFGGAAKVVGAVARGLFKIFG